MARKRKQDRQTAAEQQTLDDATDEHVEPEAGVDEGEDETPAEGSATGVELVEPAEEAVKRLESELDTLNDKYLRLAAEFDNYRKRVVRDRAELRERSQAELLRDMLEALDDLGRVTDLTSDDANVADVIEGVAMVERKLLDELTRAGMERLGQPGDVFDPHMHEAVGSLPAAQAGQDGTVAEVLQTGYRLGSVLLRPARVVVYVGEPEHDDSADDG
ncbi:MAG: nucleotide exchange factor GrpE [Gemmatimonadales bacterium]|jgi:molecular chaperone GrpE